MSRSRYKIFENEFPYFLTCTIVGWLPVFARPNLGQIVFDSWRFLAENERMTIFGYVILENHLHMIASSPNLTKEAGDFKSFTSRRIIDGLIAQNAHCVLDQLKWHKEKHKSDRTY